ncbi:hypothetical protein BAUCODRAFT_326963 [Baudoinia panamericana UAMH 10762]|uniref:Uncharacterized protein n=1 Tax=Baudoinia panamericana (strain UAMH 10762) TaxID=717646 RepID=M2MJF6_BAUPA|nr:uncharacterized protein BAUCODRAFT_326963 [Baudoinia panamericana UAMH 10762]EMC91418.1 hypothetical protein BAUCODRAFT_326963 [Baudoinia panamericana UAMH 10762]
MEGTSVARHQLSRFIVHIVRQGDWKQSKLSTEHLRFNYNTYHRAVYDASLVWRAAPHRAQFPHTVMYIHTHIYPVTFPQRPSRKLSDAVIRRWLYRF